MWGIPRLCGIALEHRLIERDAKNTLKSLQRDETFASTQDEWPIPGSGGETQCTVKRNLELRHHDGCSSFDRCGQDTLWQT
jgi:hypothetical protein